MLRISIDRHKSRCSIWSGLASPLQNRSSVMFFILIVAWHAKLMANTIKASSPSQPDVQTAINSAGNDDTVIVPAGTANWSSTLVFTKGITLVGSTTTDSVAGTAKDQTIIQDSVPRVSGSGPFIKITTVLGNFYRVSGFTFQNGSATTSSVNGAIQILGDSHSVRLDHCHFMPMTYQGPDVQIKGAIFGVADHNVLEFTSKKAAFLFYAPNWPNPDGRAGTNGDGSWATPTNFGSQEFFFVEDNYITNLTSPFIEGPGHTDDSMGARWVFRHNHCYDTEVQTHGTECCRFRGGRAREVYNNDFHYAHLHPYGGIRSGVTITHDNTFDGVKPKSGMALEAYRAFFKFPGTPLPSWGGGTGDNPWDSNDTRNGPFTENSFNYNPVNGLYESGTASSGSSKTALVDTTKNWAPNQWQYFVAKRVSDNQVAFINSNASNTLTVTYYTDSGGGAVWAAGDQYQIHRPLVLLDQPGRGQGDLIVGSMPVNRATRRGTWPHEALEPTYSWNNIYIPNGASVDVYAHPLDNVKLQREGRDYYNNTPMPGYKPYTYPHPLTKTATKPSQASKKELKARENVFRSKLDGSLHRAGGRWKD